MDKKMIKINNTDLKKEDFITVVSNLNTNDMNSEVEELKTFKNDEDEN
jgi:hypothetical protein